MRAPSRRLGTRRKTPEQWQLVRSVFDAALACAPAGRVRLLARVKPDEEGRFSPFARDRLAELRRSLR